MIQLPIQENSKDSVTRISSIFSENTTPNHNKLGMYIVYIDELHNKKETLKIK